MENQQRQQIKKYLDLFVLHWKLIAVCLLVAMTLGPALYLRMPQVYQCESLLSYERQRINPSRMAPEQDHQRLRDTISTLSNVVINRNNLEDIIIQFELYKGSRQRLSIEDVIDMMREHIRITPSTRGGTFTVSFEGQDQNKVMKVTDGLAAKFIEWNALTRDYDELSRHYDFLESQNLQTSSVEHLDRKQKGIKFKIVDSAVFPDKPYKPNFLIIFLIAVGAGLGGGACLVFIKDFVDTSFMDAWEIERYLDIPVVSSIPYLERQDEAGKKRKKIVLWSVGFLLYSGLLLAALVYFWQQGRIIL
jgi:uncharacterized protein involved in exopolysaccharide biosynthesis